MKPAAPLTPSQQRQHEKWRRFRANGRRHFILRWGVAYWGGLMFVIMGVVKPLVTEGASGLSPRLLLVNALVWLVAGVAFGALTWHFSEKKFLENESRNDSE